MVIVLCFGLIFGGGLSYIAKVHQRAVELAQKQREEEERQRRKVQAAIEANAEKQREERRDNDTKDTGDRGSGYFYFPVLETMDDVDDDAAICAAFDSLMRRYGEIDDIVSKGIPRNLSVKEIKARAKMYQYIKSSNPRVDDSIAIIEVAAVSYYGDKYRLPHGLVMGVLQTESNFKPTAVSSASARGLMQVMWKYHGALLQSQEIAQTESDLHNPEKGIAAGCLILSRYIQDEKSLVGGLKRYYGELSYNYVSSVLSNWHAFETFALGLVGEEGKTAERSNWARMAMAGRTGSAGSAASSAKAAPAVNVSYVSKGDAGANAGDGQSAQKVAQNPPSIRVFDLKGYIAVYDQDGKVKKEWKNE